VCVEVFSSVLRVGLCTFDVSLAYVLTAIGHAELHRTFSCTGRRSTRYQRAASCWAAHRSNQTLHPWPHRHSYRTLYPARCVRVCCCFAVHIPQQHISRPARFWWSGWLACKGLTCDMASDSFKCDTTHSCVTELMTHSHCLEKARLERNGGSAAEDIEFVTPLYEWHDLFICTYSYAHFVSYASERFVVDESASAFCMTHLSFNESPIQERNGAHVCVYIYIHYVYIYNVCRYICKTQYIFIYIVVLKKGMDA